MFSLVLLFAAQHNEDLMTRVLGKCGVSVAISILVALGLGLNFLLDCWEKKCIEKCGSEEEGKREFKRKWGMLVFCLIGGIGAIAGGAIIYYMMAAKAMR